MQYCSLHETDRISMPALLGTRTTPYEGERKEKYETVRTIDAWFEHLGSQNTATRTAAVVARSTRLTFPSPRMGLGVTPGRAGSRHQRRSASGLHATPGCPRSRLPFKTTNSVHSHSRPMPWRQGRHRHNWVKNIAEYPPRRSHLCF